MTPEIKVIQVKDLTGPIMVYSTHATESRARQMCRRIIKEYDIPAFVVYKPKDRFDAVYYVGVYRGD